jgi:ABC-type lipoprotein export system ATPase subunit
VINRIECRNIVKEFKGDGVSTKAVQDVNVTFTKGEFTAIVGPSGSGKSTLLSSIGTLDEPTSGEVLFDEKPLPRMKKNAIADFRFENIGFVFQQFHLLPTLNVIENVLSPLFARRVSYDKTIRSEEVLEQVGLSNKRFALPSQLSGGEQQRVAIARAIIHKPNWLLADEPTGNLDTKTGRKIFDLMKVLNAEAGCGVIFVTHDKQLANQADRVIEMKDGVIISDQRNHRITV